MPVADDGMQVDLPSGAPSAQVVNALVNAAIANAGIRSSSVPAIPQRYLVGYVYSEQMILHNRLPEIGDPDDEHPEKPARILEVNKLFERNDLLRSMKRIPIRLLRKDEALLVHAEQLWNDVQKFADFSHEDVVTTAEYFEHQSLYVCPSTPLAARYSCGGAVEACLAVARGEVQKAFANVRPPGHHAEPDQCMGFCFFNNVAVAARVVQQKTHIKRILVLDWDVHHGNGIQKAFSDDPSILYVSLHRYDNGSFYPNGTYGAYDSCGEGKGRGYSVNIPWPTSGMGDQDYLLAFQSVIMPIATEFAPEMVIIAAGFDSADGDPLGGCHVTPAGYAHMTHMLCGLAGGRVAVVLEGGYNVHSVARSALSVGRTLLGESPPEMEPLLASEEGSETIFAVAKFQSKFWKNIDIKACEPREQETEDVTWTIPELLKAHRAEYMYRDLGMLELPVLTGHGLDLYSSQIMCTKDILVAKTVVLFVHEFGDIKAEIANSITCEVQQEHSYLVDASKRVVQWCKQENYALMDVNLHTKAPLITRIEKDSVRGIMTYLWDNYLVLSTAQNYILVGHGQGVVGLMELINARSSTIRNNVRLVAQFVGLSPLPMVPKADDALVEWYWKHSLIIIPPDHPVRKIPKTIRRHGRTVVIDELKPIKLLIAGLDDLRREVKKRLEGRA